MANFGDYVRSRRAEVGLTLRQFCVDADLDPAYVSRVERGLRQAPSDLAMLRRWAKFLFIRPESREWEEFSDLASISAGRLPEDLLSDEEVADKLPMLFRTLRSDQPPEEALRKIVDIVRRG
ncbi:MAG: helix-turn-helix transcriptional regulator [Planctomycetota bacterium]